MKILFTGLNYKQGLKNIDSSNYFSTAKSMGYSCVNSLLDNPDVLVCVDYSRSVLSSVRSAKERGIKTVLISCEPSVVIPQNSKRRITRLFDKVVLVGRPGSHVLKWPQSWRTLNENSDRLGKAILVNSDKWSFISGQLYWLRAALWRSVKYLDVAGNGWNKSFGVRLGHRLFELLRTLCNLCVPNFDGGFYCLSKPENFVGTPEDKIALMANYRVALVIENSLEYLSEKLFDAWFAGCIPVYVGAPVEHFGLPPNLVLQSEARPKSVRHAMDQALSMSHIDFLTRLKDFLESPEAATWRSEIAMRQVISSALN